jgi:biotin operon repressor
MSQNETLIAHLMTVGSISQREAMLDYHVQSLTKRISELRKQGYEIKSETKRHPTSGQRYVRYVMEGARV